MYLCLLVPFVISHIRVQLLYFCIYITSLHYSYTYRGQKLCRFWYLVTSAMGMTFHHKKLNETSISIDLALDIRAIKVHAKENALKIKAMNIQVFE